MPPIRFEKERLVDGLTQAERLARIELRVFGSRVVPGLDRDVDALKGRIEELEAVRRRQELGFLGRLLLKIGRAPRRAR